MSNTTILRPTRRDRSVCHFSRDQTGHGATRSARERASLGEDHRRASATVGDRVRAAIDAASGARTSGVDGAAVRLGGSGRGVGLARAAVQVIDEDQGHSGSSAEGRSGFQRCWRRSVPIAWD